MYDTDEDLRGFWQAVAHVDREVIDPGMFDTVDPLSITIQVVRRSLTPVDGRVPFGNPWDEAHSTGQLVDDDTVAGAWARAVAMASGLNAAAEALPDTKPTATDAPNIADAGGRGGIVHRATADQADTPICPLGAKAAELGAADYAETPRQLNCPACLRILLEVDQ